MAVRLLTAKEAADVLRLGKSKIYLMVRRGELTAIYLNRAGRRAMRFRRSDLDLVAAHPGRQDPRDPKIRHPMMVSRETDAKWAATGAATGAVNPDQSLQSIAPIATHME
jgi:excisionase family DNA binding protein